MMLYRLDVSLNSPTLPLYLERISAGFPSPAADYMDEGINLVKHLISHPSATYVLRVSGESMRDAGILDGSLLLVDSSLRADHHDIVVACLNGEFTVKRLVLRPTPHLRAENPEYAPILLNDEDDTRIVGVVTTVINTFRRVCTRQSAS
ncbi:translesion error-prone DNA polymerase V autoproteolytic subunit [Dryocola sp. LX212]|jgi:DNA polymerase V